MAPILLSILFFNLLVSSSSMKSSRLNKNTRVSRAETVYGEVYDCVDVHKQHSLTHPALRHHKVKMMHRKSSSTLPYERNANTENSTNVEYDYKNLWKSKRGCPRGTVPVQRTTLNSSLKWRGGVDFAGIFTSKPGKRYYGVSAKISLENPRVFSNEEYSSAIISLESGQGSNFNQIQVGWTVNPKLYGDTRTRLFIKWTRDSYHSTGCYNTHCPGFVMLNNKVPLGHAFEHISVSQGQQFDVRFNVTLDPVNGWGFVVGGWDTVGYWPISIFTGLQRGADKIRFGGEVYTSTNDKISPQMGSGAFKNGQFDRTANMKQVVVIDETKRVIDVNNDLITQIDSRCYYAGDNSYKNGKEGYSFDFGGKGGKDESTCLY